MRFHDEARRELGEAALWYEERDRGLGTRFLDEVEQILAHIKRSPVLGMRWLVGGLPEHVEVRRLPLRKFPYLVVYIVEPEPTVVAVAHGRRRPGYWTGRL